MAITLQSGYSAMATTTNLYKTQNALGVSQTRLGTGNRINSAADDAAGLQMVTRLEGQSRGMSMSIRNISDATSMLQVGEGALNEMTDILQRMKDLATLGANDTNSAKDREAMQAEFDQLGVEIANILDNTTYAGEKLFSSDKDDTASKFNKAVNFQIGATADEKLVLDLSDASGTGEVKALAEALIALSKTFEEGKSDKDTAGTEITTSANATITLANTALEATTSLRSKFGATINRLGHTSNNLSNMKDNTEAAAGLLKNTDFAAESSKLTMNSMLMQSSVSMLKQSSQLSSLAMSLLG